MRSLLVALDDTPASAAAAKLAIALAAKHGSALSGANVLDVDYLTAAELGGVGTAYYKYKTDLARLKEAHERGERLASAFLQQCKTQSVKGELLALEGRPSEQLCRAAAVHDVIVIGQDSDFHGQPGGDVAKTVQRILQDNPRPLIVTPSTVRDPSSIAIAYDGSLPAARTLQIFVLLGLATNCNLHVISISSESDGAEQRVSDASAYLGLHGIECTAIPIVSKADPADLVIAETRRLGADLLVMGAYGHRGWREALLGSFTTRLLSECPAALFVHH